MDEQRRRRTSMDFNELCSYPGCRTKAAHRRHVVYDGSNNFDCLVTGMANNLINLIPRGRAAFRRVLLEPRSFLFP